MAPILMDNPIYIQRVEVAPAEECFGDRIKILFKGDKHVNILVREDTDGKITLTSEYFVTA